MGDLESFFLGDVVVWREILELGGKVFFLFEKKNA